MNTTFPTPENQLRDGNAYGAIKDLDAALYAAQEAEADDLRGYFPAAAVVLAREVRRLMDLIADDAADIAEECQS